MPAINSAGTYTKDDANLGRLGATPRKRVFHFSGASVGTTLEVRGKDDAGTFSTLENGAITSLPRSFSIEANIELDINTTGSPDFNVTVK